MSTFYGSIRGNRSTTTRGGSFQSGYKATAQSYNGSIIVYLSYDKENTLKVGIETSDTSSMYGGWSCPTFNGTFEEFKTLLQLNEDIKNGKVSIVKHRQKKN